MGRVKWLLKYIFNPKFRFHEELEAEKAEFAFMKKRGWQYNMDIYARVFSGKTYFNPVSFEYAKKELTKAWEDA